MKNVLFLIILSSASFHISGMNTAAPACEYSNENDDGNSPVPPFDIEAFLNQRRAEKGNVLTVDERQKLTEYMEYLESRKNRIKQVLLDNDCEQPSTEQKGSTTVPKEFADEVQARLWLHRSILNDNEIEVKEVVAGMERLYSSSSNSPKERVKQEFCSHNYKGKSPLYWAVFLARPRAVNALLECGAHPDKVIAGYSDSGSFPRSNVITGSIPIEFCTVHHALLLGDIKSALALVRHGARFSGCVCTECGQQPGQRINHKDAMGAVFDSYPQASEECLELVQELFNRGYKISSDYQTNIWRNAICSPGGLDRLLVKLFLKNGADINQLVPGPGGTMYSPLVWAIESESLVATRALLDEGADPIGPNKNRTPCSHVTRWMAKRVQMTELLQSYGAK